MFYCRYLARAAWCSWKRLSVVQCGVETLGRTRPMSQWMPTQHRSAKGRYQHVETIKNNHTNV